MHTLSGMKVLVLLNAAAGTLASSQSRDEAQRITTMFTGHGVTAEVRGVPGEQLKEVARQATEGDYGIIVAGGGDGTLNAVASQLVGTGKVFGILPLGTMNHLAKELNIPLELEQAVAAIVRGRVVDLPVGQVNGRVFLSFSGIGLYPNIVKHRDAQRSALGRGKWLAMAIAFVQTLRRLPLFRVRLRSGDDVMRRLTPLAFVALSEYQLRLMGVKEYSCGARTTLSLFITRRTSRLGMIGLMVRAILRMLRPPGDFEVLCLDRFSLDTRRRHLRVAIDGEVIDLPTPLEYAMCPHALKIVLP